MYKTKKYRVKTPQEIENTKLGKSAYPHASKFFLADGNALAMETRQLKDILQRLYAGFPDLGKGLLVVRPKDLLAKGEDELLT